MYISFIYTVCKGGVMKVISLKIDDSIFGKTERIVNKLKKTRSRYINEALEYYNKVQSRKILAEKLKFESLLVRENSMEVLKEFEAIEYEN